MSFTRVHLASSDVPLCEGMDTVAWCGATIPKAAFVMFWDHATLDGELSFSGKLCRKCDEVPVADPRTKRYLYGLIPGEEARQEHE